MRVLVGIMLGLLWIAPANANEKYRIDPTTLFQSPPLLCVYEVEQFIDSNGYTRETSIRYLPPDACNIIRQGYGMPPLTPETPGEKDASREVPSKKNPIGESRSF